jgi:hypothetical protein
MVFCAALLFACVATPAARADDAYLTGYVAAVLEREFQLPDHGLEVSEGVVTLSVHGLSDEQRERLRTVLSDIPGVREVKLPERVRKIVPFPREHLFDPLLADPRWLHFSVGYQQYIGDDEITNVGATSFGERIGLLRGPAPFGGSWQLDIQAGVFALFDLGAESKDLINADYWAGLPLSYSAGRFSALARLFHQSSHLGDEFLLRTEVDRVNLSYEGLDLRLAYKIGKALRLYGGGSYLFHREPADLKPWSTQAGVEILWPDTLYGKYLQPLAALDLQNRQESDWRSDLSLRAGVQLEKSKDRAPKVQILLEYFRGRNPNGQFYERRLQYLGLGLHVHF